MSNETRPVTLHLTKDELTILRYVVPDGSDGDPLKDTYELGEYEPADPYAALASLHEKVSMAKWLGNSDQRCFGCGAVGGCLCTGGAAIP